MRNLSKKDISVIITAHAEGILVHRTLASVRRSINALENKYSSEIILHVDNPTPATKEYLDIHEKTTLSDVQIHTNSFGDLGSSRNFAIQQAHGKYIATIDADDLMSENWLRDAVDFLESQSEPTVAHSEFTIEFEGADSLIIKHGEIDHDTDTLLSVYANRWNSVIVAPRTLLLKNPYTPNSPGYGYEDWHLNSRLIAQNVHNILIPGTAIFVRRKKSNSEWQRQIQSMAVLRANPLLALSHVRSISNPFAEETPRNVGNKRYSPSEMRALAKRLANKNPLVHKIAKKAYITVKRQRILPTAPAESFIPDWLQTEWQELHAIDRQIFLSEELKKHLPIYDTLTPEHKLAGSLYKQIVDSLHFDTYDYVIFTPWLIKGGADQYAINYANTIQALRPKKRVLVVSTLPQPSVWQTKLHSGIDFLEFGIITQSAPAEIKYRLMAHLIENASISHLHIINSEFGYDFVQLHKTYLSATNKKITLTSFSQSTDSSGRVFGYSHTHVPFVYESIDFITSDNQAVITMWERDYGFDPAKMAVHRQPVSMKPLPAKRPDRSSLRLLWAARVAPEKLPGLVSEIGKLVGSSVHIDMYGTVDPDCRHSVENLPENVAYAGTFDGFESLPLERYDALLYTSLFDGMPNTLLDAARNGLPIIASAVGGIPELIENEKTGLLIKDIQNPQEYAKAIELLAADRALADTLANNAAKKIRTEFSPETYENSVKTMLGKLNY